MSSRNAPALRDDTKNGCVADYTETFQITFRKRQPCFAVLNIILNAVAKETRDTTLFS